MIALGESRRWQCRPQSRWLGGLGLGDFWATCRLENQAALNDSSPAQQRHGQRFHSWAVSSRIRLEQQTMAQRLKGRKGSRQFAEPLVCC